MKKVLWFAAAAACVLLDGRAAFATGGPTAPQAVTLVPNGTTKSGYVYGPGGTNPQQQWFVVRLKGGRTYDISATDDSGDFNVSSFVQFQLFAADGTSAAPGVANAAFDASPAVRVSNAVLNNTFAGSWRYSYKPAAATNADETIFIKVTPFYLGASQYAYFRIAVTETTLFCPWMFTDANYDGFIQLMNTTSQNVAFTVSWYGYNAVSGGATTPVGTPVAFTLPAFGTTFVTAKGQGGVTGGSAATITTNAPAGAIQANATSVNTTGVGLTHSFNILCRPITEGETFKGDGQH